MLLLSDRAHAEWQNDAFVSLSSDYVYRGVSIGNEKATPSASFALNHHSGFFVSTWLSRADIAGIARTSHPRDWEAELHVGYNFSSDDDWNYSLSYAHLDYIRDEQPRDTDYQELRFSAHYTDLSSILISHSNSLWNTGFSSTAAAYVHRFAGPVDSLVEIELGGVRMNRTRQIDYGYLRAGVGLFFADSWSGKVEYHYSGGEVREVFNDDRVGGRVTASVSYHFSL